MGSHFGIGASIRLTLLGVISLQCGCCCAKEVGFRVSYFSDFMTPKFWLSTPREYSRSLVFGSNLVPDFAFWELLCPRGSILYPFVLRFQSSICSRLLWSSVYRLECSLFRIELVPSVYFRNLRTLGDCIQGKRKYFSHFWSPSVLDTKRTTCCQSCGGIERRTIVP